jgi:tyrosyl-tRNA synthetase
MQPRIDADKIDRLLNRGVEMVYPTKDALRTPLLSGKRLRLYVGVDPTAPTLHIGHALQMKKLREFQDLGHEVILLIGSFTAMIGDPTDKLAARQQLTAEQVLANAKTYKKQVGKMLKFTGDNPVKIMFNHKWLAKMTFEQVMKLASHFTVQQMSERDMFAKRLADGKPVYLHEFMYPLMQGYDSVAMDVDVEIGGNDQTFNMLAGRTLMKEMRHKEKMVVALKLLTNDEGKKMSKSEGGVIAITDTPEDMYGKIMSMSDSMILPYFEIVTDVPMEDISGMKLQLQAGANPRDLKMKLAAEVVTMFHNQAAAKRATKHFTTVFQQHEKPTDIPEHKLSSAVNILDILVDTKLATSRSEARQLIAGGGVRLDDVAVTDIGLAIDPAKLPIILQKGKRYFVKLVS